MVESVRQYGLPVLLALLLHALAVAALQVGWEPATKKIREIKPSLVMAQLIVMEPKPAPKATPKPASKTPAQSPPKPQPAAKQPVQPQPKPAAARPDPAAEKAAREAAERSAQQAAAEKAARQARLAELAKLPTDRALQEEAAALARDAQAANEAATQTYQAGIYQKVVDNWSRPPSARNGMEAELLVELVPTGDVVAVTLLKSSGNAAFDQSAEAAVRKARRFEVPRESALFERRFRRFNLLFRPEDLLR